MTRSISRGTSPAVAAAKTRRSGADNIKSAAGYYQPLDAEPLALWAAEPGGAGGSSKGDAAARDAKFGLPSYYQRRCHSGQTEQTRSEFNVSIRVSI